MSELDLTAAAKSLFQWDIEHHREPRPTWDGLTNEQRDVWHSGAVAVLPHIREALAQQIEAERPETGFGILMTERRGALVDGLNTAACIVRGDPS